MRLCVAVLLATTIAGCESNRDAGMGVRSAIRAEINCDECGGGGVVSYRKDDAMVALGGYVAGREYPCPMCGGSGKLDEFVLRGAGE